MDALWGLLVAAVWGLLYAVGHLLGALLSGFSFM